ncbi:MAG TPA: NADH:flavin oxidoreductase/NADH oxidase family protein [Limnobacter sp.]|uniref:NADH:flavin oxidoreductase/NADH oxidase family protein n=1 Tax=Limnobacter sp. TaxID=2003368 RepID=UPI002ED90F07
MKTFTPLTLPNGTQLPNRLAKAAMEENMANADHAPSEALIRLYGEWAAGEVGLMITGNVMIDHRAMTGPGGVVLESDLHAELFKRWAKAAKAKGAQVWMQINHPGRQMQANLGQPTVAPSPVALDMGSFSKQFAVPRELTEADIADLRNRYIRTAVLAEQYGFDGVQIHAAHGYLLSQFLSPITNKRADQWGGSIENRARLLTEVVKGVRSQVGKQFSVSVKINSADFQRGGFSEDDAKRVIELLNPLGLDLIELSGGSYEAPAMQGQSRDGRTLAREAYFLEFAKDIAQVAKVPIMVTGGIRRLPIAEQVLDSGIDMVGIATALALNPMLPAEWKAGQQAAPELRPITWKNKVLASLAYMAMVKYQLHRMGKGRQPNGQVSPLKALLKQQLETVFRTRQYRRWVGSLGQ